MIVGGLDIKLAVPACYQICKPSDKATATGSSRTVLARDGSEREGKERRADVASSLML